MMIKVLAFGELLWDIIGGKAYIGGAPFNLASHLAKMGVHSTYISTVGKDSLGEKALKIAEKYGLDPSYIAIHPHLPTGKVDVYLNHKGHPKYTIHKDTAWDQIILKEGCRDLLFRENWAAFCFGTLAQRTESNRKVLQGLFSNLNCEYIFYDVNLRKNFYQKEWIERSLYFSNILKLNEEEVTTLSELLLGKVVSKEEFCHAISSEYSLKIICITLGENGSILYDGKDFFRVPGVKVKVVDTVGAGDSFSAAFLFSLLSGLTPRESGLFANQMGAFVASQSGAVPEYSSILKEQIKMIKK